MKKIGIIGGDLRNIRLTEAFAKDEYFIYTYAIDKYNFIDKSIIKCSDIKKIANECDYIISSIPFTKDNKYLYTPFSNEKIEIKSLLEIIRNKKLFAGSINESIKEYAVTKNIEIIDLMEMEAFTILNVIPTVEGAIKIAIEKTEITLNGANCLILGFGRIGKLLAKVLDSFGAEVYCVARKESDISWIKAYGYNPINLYDLEKKINNKKYDLIFNTIPHIIIDAKKLDILRNSNPLIIELASKPWGIDYEYAKKIGINAIIAPGLPGKVAPFTSAINMKKIIKKIIIQ